VPARLSEHRPIVLSRHAPRDGGARIQDHWYRRIGPGLAHPLPDPPSLRARRDLDRVRCDLGTGGFLNVRIEALVRHLVRGISPAPRPDYTHALARALVKNMQLAIW